jgi:hypothetical protein
MVCLNLLGYATYSWNYVVLSQKLLWYIVTTSTEFTFPTTLFNISAPSILKWIYISCVRKLPAVKYVFYTFPRVFRLLTSSHRDFRYNSLMTFVIVSTFVHLQYRLRGCIRYVNIERWLWALINRIMTTYLYDVYIWLSDQWKGTT